ncbi:MAG: cytochrome P450, partial [Polyangia bacterium]
RERAQGHFDVVPDLGVALSLGTVLSIMGLPQKDSGRIKHWTEALSVLLDAAQLLPGLPAAHRAAAEIIAYFQDAIAERRRDPRPLIVDDRPRDLLCGLIAARDLADQLSDEELIATAVFTLMAAHETVTSVIGSGLLALCSRPAEWARLCADPSLAASAFDEMLRFEPPAQITTKTAREDLEIDGRLIRKGQVVVAVLAAANRDPEQFPDPDRFDIGRRDSRHLAFSLGPHYCVGAGLARLEGQLLLAALAQRLPGLTIFPQQAVRKPGIVLRGLRSLPARSRANRREATSEKAGGPA